MRIANAEEMADFWMNARCEVRGENVCESGGGGGLIVGKEKRVGQKGQNMNSTGLVWFGLV